jgi:hypothetical protein
MHDSILLAYAKAMWAAQKLESSLKMLFSLHNIISGISKAQAPLTDEEFDELFYFPSKDKWPKNKQPIDKLTMGAVKDMLLLRMLPDLGLSPFPENATKALRATIQARNFVAHHYFLVRGRLAEDPDALPTLIAELDWHSEVFNAWLPILDRWIDMLMKAMGYTDDDMKELQNIVDEGPPADLRQDLLTDLKNQLAQIGITVPPPVQESTT